MWRMKDKTLEGVEADKIKRNFGVYAILLTALFAMTFFGVCDPSGRMRNGGPQGSAAVVQGEVITRADFARAYDSKRQQYARMYGEQFDPAAIQLASTVINELVDNRAMYLKAVDLGLMASNEEVISAIQREDLFKDDKGQFSEEIYDRFFQNSGYTQASLVSEVRRNLTVDKLRRFVSETNYVSSKAAELDFRLAETKVDVEYVKVDPQKVELTIAPDEVQKFVADEANKVKIKEYYDGNQREFNQPEQVKARHILVQFKGSRNAVPEAAAREKADAEKRAQEILAKVKTGDFAELAKQNTDEAQGKTNGGDLGWFTRDAMDKAFSDAAFALGKGETSGVVESPFGFHIIKVEDKKAAQATSLEEATPKIAESLIAKEKRPVIAKERATKIADTLKAGQPVDALLAEYKLAWAATGDTAADARMLPGIGSSKEVGDALASLVKPGDLYPTPVDVRGNLYVLRLKSRKEPDMSKFDEEKRRELAASAAYTDGTTLFNLYEKQVREELEKKKAISRNQSYLAMDQRSEKKDDASEN